MRRVLFLYEYLPPQANTDTAQIHKAAQRFIVSAFMLFALYAVRPLFSVFCPPIQKPVRIFVSARV